MSPWWGPRDGRRATQRDENNKRKRLAEEPITVNRLHPGTLLDTKMVRQAFSKARGSAESGAEVEVYLATSPDVADISGVCFDRQSKSRAHDQAYDQKARDRQWRRTPKLTGVATYAEAQT